MNPARDSQPEAGVLVAASYRFVPLTDFRALRGPLQQRCAELGLLGTILLAEEGINGTVSGPEAGVRALMSKLRADARFAGLEFKLSRAREV
ncbi:MAG TPA: sulfurtransferase, partial [Xanthomonadales bacterium]|nr:sulfurtransferase [Xanthomonadales bacterium]